MNLRIDSRRDRLLRIALPMASGIALAFAGVWVARDPMNRAFWSLASVVLLLPMGVSHQAREGDRPPRGLDAIGYAAAVVPVLLWTWMVANAGAMIVVASVAFSLIGAAALLTWLRLSAAVAVGVLIVQSVLFLTWPVWMSHLLLRFDLQWLVDGLVKIGPMFAINAAIDPTDAFTHRPLAYRLMNLGQDVPYQMPASIWVSVIVHVVAGLPGFVLIGRWGRRTSTAAS